jgi:cell division topological specificity factor
MLQELFDRLFSRSASQKTSRETVKHRLKILLAHDRTDLSPAMVEKMRQEIIEVVSRYVEIDAEGAEFLLESDQRSTALIANLPIRGVKLEALLSASSMDAVAAAADDAADDVPAKDASAPPPADDTLSAAVLQPQPSDEATPLLLQPEISSESLDLWLDSTDSSNPEKRPKPSAE